MLKKIAFLLMLSFFCTYMVYSADVEIKTQIYEESTIFEYLISFDKTENYKSFSFEKPKDAKMIYVLESNSNVEYSSAGDYFIIKPEETLEKNFTIKFVSISKSEEIKNENIFSTYASFNFPVDKLKFVVSLKDDFGKQLEIVPRNYELDKAGNLVWDLNEVTNDTFFLIKFGEKEEKRFFIFTFLENYWHILLLLFVLILFVWSAIIFKKKGYAQKITVEKLKVNPFKKKENLPKQEIVDEEKFEELTSKYLTENEKEVVEVVKNNQGISQFDILNYLPNITKSNLSKIISKLHSKKILSRIKVGKINKIYLGDKIEKGKIEEEIEEEK